MQSGKKYFSANISALTKEMQTLRDKQESFLPQAAQIASQLDILPQFKKEHRRPEKNRFHDETTKEETVQDCAATVFCNTVFFTAIDSVIGDLDIRFHPTSKIFKEFPVVSIVGQISEDKSTPKILLLSLRLKLDTEYTLTLFLLVCPFLAS